MNYLLLDTTKKSALIAIRINNVEKVRVLGENMPHSEHLLTQIDEMLNEFNCNIGSINCFGVVLGPGSFTGLRIGIATIKAFAAVLNNAKLIAFNVFSALSNHFKNGTILLNCTKTSFYASEIKSGKVKNINVIETANVENIRGNIFKLKDEPINGLETYKNIKLIENYNELIVSHFKKEMENKNFCKLEEIEPVYVQPSQAERELKEKNEKNAN